jgi:hypothetical protein
VLELCHLPPNLKYMGFSLNILKGKLKCWPILPLKDYWFYFLLLA